MKTCKLSVFGFCAGFQNFKARVFNSVYKALNTIKAYLVHIIKRYVINRLTTQETIVNKDSWYEDNIEVPVRDLVKFLRNNGINTECSCGHDKYIQCQYIPDGEIQRLIKLMYGYFCDIKKERALSKINFEINISISVQAGHQYPTLDIKFPT